MPTTPTAVQATPLPCSSCTTLPPPLPDTGTLYLCPPDGGAEAALARHGLQADPVAPGVLAAAVTPGVLDRLGEAAAADPDGHLWGTTRAALVPAGIAPTPAALMAARPLGELLGQTRGRWLADVLREDRLTTHFQPIVDAADPAAVHGYECLLRGVEPDGGPIPPGRLFAAARAGGLLFYLDRTARITAIRSAVRQGISARVFVNFCPTSIYNPATCLRTTFRVVGECGLAPGQVVFEVVESEEVRETKHLIDLLTEYRRAGFRVALDDVGAGYSSLNLLARLQPDYLKLDMQLIRGVDADPYKGQVVGKLLEMARGLGVRTIAEGIETPAEWAWVRAHGANFVQGYLFARPAAVPPVPTVPS